MALFTKVHILALVLFAVASLANSATSCGPKGEMMGCYKTDHHRGNFIRILAQVIIRVNLTYTWKMYRHPCEAVQPANGEPPAGATMVNHQQDQVALGEVGHIKMPPNTPGTCYYCQISGCSAGGKQYPCSQAMTATPTQ
ncbi:hypothetical protein HDE_03962 [Halotydeus destructor]|nr:hypothetical protein HDE_03962 [Halotydeus destructor]